MSLKSSKILLTGGGGFLGQRIIAELARRGVASGRIVIPRSRDADLRNGAVCRRLVRGVDLIIHAAANVGGIEYNRAHPGALLYDNTMMSLNLLEAARVAGTKKFVGIGSVCEYPSNTPIPFQETRLWDGFPEASNGSYGLAKRMMLAQGRAYRDEFGLNAIHLLLINLYGPGDHFDPTRSHVITALANRLIDAKARGLASVEVWGTGKATREFLYVDDAARAIVLAAERYDKPEPINIGSGQEVAIASLAEQLKDIIGYRGALVWDASKPDGQLRRCVDATRAESEFGFRAETSLSDGLRRAVDDFLRTRHSA